MMRLRVVAEEVMKSPASTNWIAQVTFVSALALAAAASAQEFVGVPNLPAQLGAIRQAAAQLRVYKAAEEASPFDMHGLASPNPPVDEYPVRGMDVSAYQGEIEWDQVKKAGLSFVFIRAVHGNEPVDKMFAENWAGATSIGLRKGAYLFYELCQPALAQARTFIGAVPVTPGALPPVVDVEASKACPTLPPKEQFLKNLEAITGLLKRTYGKTPILYVNGNVYKTYFEGANVPNVIWFANPRETPQLPDGRDWNFWQYSWTGRIPGISGAVDLDVFNGTPAAFDALFPQTDRLVNVGAVSDVDAPVLAAL